MREEVLPVGAYPLIVSPIWLVLKRSELRAQNVIEGPEPLYGTLFSYVNGMETPLVLLAYAMALWFWTRRKVEDRPALFGFLLSIVALASLDHVFIAIALFALAAFRLLSNRRRPLELALG
ncbi:MAG TPA: hypothetical protein VGL13_13425, partial [Polyangiaceae bacterium]